MQQLALIALEIARSNATEPDKLTLKDKILKFTFTRKSSGPELEKASNADEDLKERIRLSKLAHLTAVGHFRKRASENAKAALQRWRERKRSK